MFVVTIISLLYYPSLYCWLCRLEVEIRPPRTQKIIPGPQTNRKIIGALLLSFGNVGLDYYFTEKSVACMLTFLFLAVYFLSILCCIQPCTDFGILELLLSASSVVAFRRFGVLHFNSWLVIVACVFIDVTRYWLDPEREEQVEASEQSSLESGEVIARNGTDENRESRAHQRSRNHQDRGPRQIEMDEAV